MLMPTPPFNKRKKERKRWMKMMTLLQKDHSRILLLLEPIQRFPKHPITPRSSPQEHPSTPGHSNSQLDHPMETPTRQPQTPRESGSQTSWEQVFPHPIPIKQAVFPYIVCLLLLERDAPEGDLSLHKELHPMGKTLQERPSLLYPLSQRSLSGAPWAICLAAPLGEEHLNPDIPRFLRGSPMRALAEDAPEVSHRTPLETTRQTLLEAIRLPLLEATHQTLPEAIRLTHPVATHPKDHPVAAHLRDHLVAALLKDHPVATRLKDHPVAALPRDHLEETHPKDHPAAPLPEATHLRGHLVAALPKAHPAADHLRGHPAAALPKDHPVVLPRVHPAAAHHKALPAAAHHKALLAAAHHKALPAAAHLRAHLAGANLPPSGGKARPDCLGCLAHQEALVLASPHLSQSITRSHSRHQHHPGSRLPPQRTSWESPRRPRSS